MHRHCLTAFTCLCATLVAGCEHRPPAASAPDGATSPNGPKPTPAGPGEDWPRQRRQLFSQLQAYQDRELDDLAPAEQAEVDRLITSLALTNEGMTGRPLRLWRLEAIGLPTLWVAVKGSAAATEVEALAFEDTGRHLVQYTLRLGEGFHLGSLRLRPDDRGGYPLAVLGAEPDEPGGERLVQYYAWVGGRFDLVRVETRAGTAVRNDYRGDARMGTAQRRVTSAAEWEVALRSQDRNTVLGAVVWLGGRRPAVTGGNPIAEPTQGARDDQAEARMVAGLLASPEVIARLKELATGNDPWLRDGAALALTPLGRR